MASSIVFLRIPSECVAARPDVKVVEINGTDDAMWSLYAALPVHARGLVRRMKYGNSGAFFVCEYSKEFARDLEQRVLKAMITTPIS